MKDFASVGQVIGTFPSVTAKMCSGSGATDGTPIASDTTNNYWGFFQMLMSRAGLTASGVLEAYTVANAFNHTTPGQATMTLTTAQFLQAMQYQFASPGELVLWCRSQAPATVGARVLLLQGQTIAVATYPDLCNAVYCGDSVNNTSGVPFYLSSDSGGVTRATTGTYLTLPDARGVTIRGVDTGNTRDWGGSTRGGGTPNGSIQGFAMQGHLHVPTGVSAVYVSNVASGGSWTFPGAGTTMATSNPTIPVTDAQTYEAKINPAIQLASETRMINMACYIGIRY